MADNEELIAELRKHLDAQAARQEELVKELLRLRSPGEDRGTPSGEGHQALNAELRGSRGQTAPLAPAEGQDGAGAINAAIRRAAGRAPREGDR